MRSLEYQVKILIKRNIFSQLYITLYVYMMMTSPQYSFQELVKQIAPQLTMPEFNRLMLVISVDHHFYSKEEMEQL